MVFYLATACHYSTPRMLDPMDPTCGERQSTGARGVDANPENHEHPVSPSQRSARPAVQYLAELLSALASDAGPGENAGFRH